jgi:hypothetical protein
VSTVVAVALAAVALAGCGAGTPALAVPALVSKVDAICRAYSARMEGLAAPSFAPASATAAELSAAARYLDKAVPLLRSEQASITGAGQPRADRAMYATVRGALAAHVRDEIAARKAAHAQDLSAFRAAVAADQRASTRLAGAAQQFGLDSCV